MGYGAADCFDCSQTQFVQDSEVNAKKSHSLFFLKRIDMLLTWRTIYWYGMWFSKSLRNAFVLISWAAPKCRERKKWEVADAMGHYSSKGSFQTQVTGWASKEKTRPKFFFFSIQKKIHVSTVNIVWKDIILLSASKRQRIVKAKVVKEKLLVIFNLEFGSASQHYLITSLIHFVFNNYTNI